MRCTICGNTRYFFVEGKELRRLDTADPYAVETFFVPTAAVCTNPSCAKCMQSGGHVELNPLYPDLVPMAAAFGLPEESSHGAQHYGTHRRRGGGRD